MGARDPGALAARERRGGSRRDVVCPSAYLRDLAVGWGVAAEERTSCPEPAPPLGPALPARERCRARRSAWTGFTLATAGRLTRQNDLVRRARGGRTRSGVRLLVAGDGPERPSPRASGPALGFADRVRFPAAPLPRRGPHAVPRGGRRALHLGLGEPPAQCCRGPRGGDTRRSRPRSAAPEVVPTGENGLLVPPATSTRSPARSAGSARSTRSSGGHSAARGRRLRWLDPRRGARARAGSADRRGGRCR